LHWAEPWWLILLVLAPLPAIFDRARPRVTWPTLDGFVVTGKRSWPARLLSRLSPVSRGLVIACLVVALARPQTVAGRIRVAGHGVAIVVALDHSSSMNGVDFPSDEGAIARLAAARTTLERFIAGRPDDLVGLVVFANYPDLACPPTLDHEFLHDAVRAVRTARPGDDGTNLGDALVWSIDVLEGSTPRKKVVVLITDGRNSPAVPRPTEPEAAARIAHELGITVHTIAVGRGGGVVRAVEPRTGLAVAADVEGPDLELLARLARLGGGRAFVASDVGALTQVFAAIDALERSPVRGEIHTRYREWYAPWVAAALALIVIDRWLAAGRLRRLP
jgi:Ca-activated chloride channel homolog